MMMKAFILLGTVFFYCSASGQTASLSSRAITPAIRAPGEPREEICFPEPIETSIAKLWGENSGEIKVDMVVGPKGNVLQLNDLKSTYIGQVADFALADLWNWKFTPGYFRGYYISAHFKVEIKVFKDSISVYIPDYAKLRGCKYSPFPTM